jgi:hypothetical protein
MNGKVYKLGNGKHIIVSNYNYYNIRLEDSGLPFVIGSDVEFTLDQDNKAIINKCLTTAEIHHNGLGWLCPKCNRVNAPFVKICDC